MKLWHTGISYKGFGFTDDICLDQFTDGFGLFVEFFDIKPSLYLFKPVCAGFELVKLC